MSLRTLIALLAVAAATAAPEVDRIKSTLFVPARGVHKMRGGSKTAAAVILAHIKGVRVDGLTTAGKAEAVRIVDSR